MKNSYLHITNGDQTTSYLQKLKLKGEFITWREMLCEGKTLTHVGSDTFWKTRFEFLKSSYKISKKKFIDYTLKEYRKLCKSNQQKEIILWFEHDLFCQINMLAVLSWLKRYRDGYTISLVTNSKKLHNFTQLTQQQIQERYQNRVILTKDNIEYADYIWQLYCADSPLRLQTIKHNNSPFTHLEEAIKAHLLRFPSIENGLNYIENNILQTVQDTNFSSKEKLVSHLLEKQEMYGFGDIQYFNKINKLKKLLRSSFNPVKLSKLGKSVLINQINYYSEISTTEAFLGGAKKYNYLYLNTTGKLLKITS